LFKNYKTQAIKSIEHETSQQVLLKFPKFISRRCAQRLFPCQMRAERRTNGNYEGTKYKYSAFHCEYTKTNKVIINTEAHTSMTQMF
jgi:hypothetical protein